MRKKAYQTPQQEIILSVPRTFVCGNDSLPYGGDDGPGIVETKDREYDDEVPIVWGNLW